MGEPNASGLWIQGPRTDNFFFGFGWIPVFLGFVIVDRYFSPKAGIQDLLIFCVLLFNFLHRHLTYPLVYGDPEQFEKRRKSYLILPLAFALLTVASFLYKPEGVRYFGATRPLYLVMIIAGVIWTMFHSIMQKFGVLRIYSRKGGYGKAWIDKGVLFSWFVFVLIHLANSPMVRKRAASMSAAGNVLSGLYASTPALMIWIAIAAFLVACVFTAFYVRQELSQPGRFHWPKNLFLLSTLLLYAVFYYDPIVGYVVFGFSHAIEYLAFVNIFARRKYSSHIPNSSLMARAVRKQAAVMTGYCLFMVTAFLLWNRFAWLSLQFYIVGSGFLHFIYDGWIWRVRNPNVAKPLGIAS